MFALVEKSISSYGIRWIFEDHALKLPGSLFYFHSSVVNYSHFKSAMGLKFNTPIE